MTAKTQNTLKEKSKVDSVENITHYKGGITIWRMTTPLYVQRSLSIQEYPTVKKELKAKTQQLIDTKNSFISLNNKTIKDTTVRVQNDSLKQVITSDKLVLDNKKVKIKRKNKTIGILILTILIENSILYLKYH